MRITLSSALALAATCHLPGVTAIDSCVHLGYSSYNGVALPNGVTQWLGIRYAAPPLGNLRFAAPQDPLPTPNGTIQADTHGPVCLARSSSNLPAKLETPDSNEDCLFMDIYAPTNATWGSLPVMFFLQGGGFSILSNSNYNGSGLVLASEMNMIVVTFNYRVGPYGFLSGQELLYNGGSLNNGLKDQRKALEWVQKHIAGFGGNPGHVVLSGDSAGASSINLQLTAYGGRDDGLFHASAAESQAFTTIFTVPESQFEYDNMVIRTGCAGDDTLACLRSLSADDIQRANYNTPFPGGTNPPKYMYGPVLDGDFVREYTYAAYARGNFVRLPAIYGDVTNEGTKFTPNTTSSYAEGNAVIKDTYPFITTAQLGKINSLYPIEDYPSFPETGRAWRQISTVYGDMRNVCPGYFINEVYARFGVPAWNYRWDVKIPELEASGAGVEHTVEKFAIWGPEYIPKSPESYLPGGINAAITPVAQGYWTSFIRAMDPNVYRKAGTPEWEAWTSECGHGFRSLKFQTNNTAMERVPEEQQRKCAYLSSIGESLRQ